MRNFVNYTPFAPMTFESVDLDDDPFQVIILKGSFKIVPDSALVPVVEQQPIMETDQYFAPPYQGSVRVESEMAPFKPAADIIINATAYPPGGKPAAQWTVSAQVREKRKVLAVTGPRFWRHNLLDGWHIGLPEPCASVPLRYEHAYGGQWEADNDQDVCDQNPAGVGYVDPEKISQAKPVPAPRIMSPDDPVIKIGKAHKPEGFSTICRSWQPRLGLAGTFDEKWQKQRHPKPPPDFKSAFYNCAHPDLIVDGYLQGDEKVELRGLHPVHETLRFCLPGYHIIGAITDRDDYRYGAMARLDTLCLHVDELRAFLIWRISLPLMADGIRSLETRFVTPQFLEQLKPLNYTPAE